MNERKLTCILCPRGCQLHVKKVNNVYVVEGNACPKGNKYGIDEMKKPTRILTSTVRINDAIYNRLPIISDQPIPIDFIFDVMEKINQVNVDAPIEYKEVIIKNVSGTGVNIIASRTMDKVK